MAGLEDLVHQRLFRPQFAVHLAGGLDGFAGLLGRELAGIARGADDHERAGGDHGKEAVFLGETERPWNHFAHAAGGPQIGLVVTHGANGHSGFDPFIPSGEVHGLVAAAAGTSDSQIFGIHLGP